MAVEEETTEETPKKTRGSNSLAYSGTSVNLNNAPSMSHNYTWPNETIEDQYIPQEIDDFTDLNAATRELLRLRVLLHRVRRQLDDARRSEAEAFAAQKNHYNREFILTSGGTEALRRAYAEIKNEQYMTRLIVAQAVAKEKMELSRTIGKEIEALKTICDNIRKQMSI